MAGWQRLNKPGDSWRWRMSHLVWGAFTIFMMGWAFLLGLLVGQGSLGTPEQVASLKGLTSAVPGLQNLAPPEEPAAPPAPVEERLQQPQLTFYDDVERNQQGQAQAQAQAKTPAPAPAKPATPAAPAAPGTPAAPAALAPPTTPAGQAVASLALAHQASATGAAPAAAPGAPPAAPATPPPPPMRVGPPILGKPEPFRPETAPPVTLAPPTAKPAQPAQHQPGQPQPFQAASGPRPAAPGPVATAPAARPPQAVASAAAPRRGRLIVQVATFQDETGARDLVNRLRSAGHPAFVLRSELEGVGPRFRVRVGPYEDIDLAQGAAGRIRIQHSLPAFVTREDQP